ADRQDIEIHEPGRPPLARVEVLVADVAPADDGDLAVGGERLVVHPPVEALEVREIAQQAPAARPEGIEQPHFNVRMGVERDAHGRPRWVSTMARTFVPMNRAPSRTRPSGVRGPRAAGPATCPRPSRGC